MRIKPMKSLLVLFLFWAGHSQAASITCRGDNAETPKVQVFTLNDVVSVGEDLPVGTTVYKATVNSGYAGVECISFDQSAEGIEFSIPSRLEFISNPTSVIPGITEPYGAEIYETNIPGIGVSLTYLAAGSRLPYVGAELSHKIDVLNAWSRQSNTAAYRLQLVKTGPISPGLVNAINFPQIKRTILQPNAPTDFNFLGFPMPESIMTFNGSIQIVKSTCQTEVTDKVVDLGSHDVNDLTSERGLLTTPWRDASLRLIGCQFSPGYYSHSGYEISSGPGNVPQGSPEFRNTVRLSLKAMTSVIRPTQGIIELTPGSDSATGVGIQIGLKDSTSSTGYRVYNFNNLETVFRPSSDAQSLDIPLIARYVSTSDVITPGKANGAVVYTLNYY